MKEKLQQQSSVSNQLEREVYDLKNKIEEQTYNLQTKNKDDQELQMKVINLQQLISKGMEEKEYLTDSIESMRKKVRESDQECKMLEDRLENSKAAQLEC